MDPEKQYSITFKSSFVPIKMNHRDYIACRMGKMPPHIKQKANHILQCSRELVAIVEAEEAAKKESLKEITH